MSEEYTPEKIEKIEKVEKSGSTKLAELQEIYEADEALTAEKAKFNKAVEKADENWEYNKSKYTVAQAVPDEGVQAPDAIRPIDQIQKSEIRVGSFSEKSVDELISRIEGTQEAISKPVDTIENTLRALEAKVADDPAAKEILEKAYKKIEQTDGQILTDKLVHIDSNLKAALAKSGAEVAQETAVVQDKNPLVRFLGYLTHSDVEMKTLITKVQGLGGGGKIEPERILTLQIKMAFVQQEIEFFTNVLNKTVESIKTTMNVQI